MRHDWFVIFLAFAGGFGAAVMVGAQGGEQFYTHAADGSRLEIP